MERVSRNIVIGNVAEASALTGIAPDIIVPKKRDHMEAPYIWHDPEIEKMTKKQEIAWREQEIRRWTEGHNGLTGSHYFALSQGFIKLPSGRTVRPWWRDTDAVTHEQYTDDFKRSNSLYIFKRRRYALSTIFGGFEPLRIALTQPGAVAGFTSCDTKRGNEIFREKLSVAFNSFDSRWNISNLDAADLKKLNRDNGIHLPEWTVFKRDTGSRDGTMLRIGFYDKKQGGQFEDELEDEDEIGFSLMPTGDTSQIAYSQTTRRKEDAAAFEGQTMQYIFVDEFFLHPYANKVLASSESSLSDGFVRTGMFITGGSAGEMSAGGIKQAQKVIKEHGNPASKTSMLFIEGCQCVDKAPELDEHGVETGNILNFMYGTARVDKGGVMRYAYSDTAKATEWIKQNRSNLEKLEDPTRLRQFIKAYPLVIEEVLESAVEGMLSPDLMELLSRRKTEILNDPNQAINGVEMRLKLGSHGEPDLVNVTRYRK